MAGRMGVIFAVRIINPLDGPLGRNRAGAATRSWALPAPMRTGWTGSTGILWCAVAVAVIGLDRRAWQAAPTSATADKWMADAQH